MAPQWNGPTLERRASTNQEKYSNQAVDHRTTEGTAGKIALPTMKCMDGVDTAKCEPGKAALRLAEKGRSIM